jgi:uncharacterized membrane protein YidH (DUF202 family)
MKDPSVLDYVNSLIHPKKRRQINFLTIFSIEEKLRKPLKSKKGLNRIPWKLISAIVLGIIAQFQLELPNRNTTYAIILYFVSGVLCWLEIPQFAFHQKPDRSPKKPSSVRMICFIFSLLFVLAAFWTFNNNRFTLINICLWLMAIIMFLYSVWERCPKNIVKKKRLNGWFILFIFAIIIVVFFRFFQLNQVPGEMFSDHAEKLLDVADVLNGQYSIFFPRNTGREAFQFYLTALIIRLFGTGLSFVSLKIGMVFAGLLTLPFIYLLGREIGNRWVGLIAFFLAGIAYWPNVISRVGLRFPLYALFTAPALFFLIRGLKNCTRNDFVLSGVALGIGLHGYSPIRILPLVILFGIGLASSSSKSVEYRKNIFWNLCLLAFTAFIIFLPLFRYAIENPIMFGIRTISRLTSIEQPLPGPAMQIFLSNLWNALTMFFYSNGEIWVHSIPFRPALDIITAVFFFIGLIFIIKRYKDKRNWVDLFIILLIPLLMLPSILSLAFPHENPSLNRTSAAILPVFIISALGFEFVFKTILTSSKGKLFKSITIGFIGMLLLISCFLNFRLVFDDYREQFLEKAWNTSEIGTVIKDFVKGGGNPNNAFVVPYPYWVDTRLVGINAGFPTKDFALNRNQIILTQSIQSPKLIIINPEDVDSIKEIDNFYSQIEEQEYISKQPGKNFIIVHVD